MLSGETGERRTILREDRLTRPEKIEYEDTVATPGAEYVEVAWRKTALEGIHEIRSSIDHITGSPPTSETPASELPPGLRTRVSEAMGPLASIELLYSTRKHHVCRVGVRRDGQQRHEVVLVSMAAVRRADEVSGLIDELDT